MSRYVNRLKSKKDKKNLTFWAGFLEALRIYGLSPSILGYYLRVFAENPELVTLVQEKRVSDRLFRLLARPKLRPYLPELLRNLRAGADQEEVYQKAKGILAELRPRPQERGYKYLLKARNLLGEEGLREYLAYLEEKSRGREAPRGN